MIVREASPADTEALAEIFYRAVHIGAATAYSKEQLNAWVDQKPKAQVWAKRLDGLLTLVADRDGVTIGFISVRLSDGFIDLIFVSPEVLGTGVAHALYTEVEARSRAAGVSRLFSHASHMAKPFFERRGWHVVAANQVDRGRILIDNWVMETSLS